jgi:hypothetical protein
MMASKEIHRNGTLLITLLNACSKLSKEIEYIQSSFVYHDVLFVTSSTHDSHALDHDIVKQMLSRFRSRDTFLRSAPLFL